MDPPGRVCCFRAPPPDDHRPESRRPADDRPARQLDHLQRRDLQLPRAAPRARRRPVSARLGHRGAPARPTSAGAPTALDAAARHVRLRALGRADGRLFCARDRFGIKPLYYATVDDVVYFASEAKALLPFLPAIETDLEALQGLPGVPVLPGRQDAVQGHRGAAARPLPARAATANVAVERYWEVYYDPDFDHTATLLRGAARDAAARSPSSSTCAATCRSARISAAASTRASSPRLRASSTRRTRCRLHRASSPTDPSYDESRYARALAELARLRPARARHRRRRLRRQHRRRHLPPRLSGRRARARFRSIMVSQARSRARARSCSAARAATRSSAATPAT